MPKKKTVRNAYLIFMEKTRDEMNSQNPARPFSLKDISAVCSPLWQKMSPENKKVYEDMAKKEKMLLKGMGETKYTTTGLPVSVVESKERELLEKGVKMRQDIKDTIESLSEKDLMTHRFYFIHANFFCICDDGDYIPAELAVSCFSLKYGIEKYYHTMINPGDLPMGYTYKAQKHSEETHGIPTPPTDLGEGSFVKILGDVQDFLNEDGEACVTPPLYTVNEFEPGVSHLLSKLCYEAGVERTLKVYDLVQLFYDLKSRVSFLVGKPGFPVYCLAEAEIENDVYAYTKEICCYWHEGSESPQYCSLSRTRRWGFHIADHCCKDIDVTLIPGQHLPATDKYFQDGPIENFQPRRHDKKPPQPADRENPKPASSKPTKQDCWALRQPNTMATALAQAKPDFLQPSNSDSEFPPLGKRLGANFGNKPK